MCPNCGEPLVVFEVEGIEVDHCLACGGTWLDTGELELIGERRGTEPGVLSQALESAKSKGRKNRRCPRCSKRMEAIDAGAPERLEIDRCPRGHGLWLDRGELVRLIKSRGSAEENAVAQFFDNLFSSEIDSQVKGG